MRRRALTGLAIASALILIAPPLFCQGPPAPDGMAARLRTLLEAQTRLGPRPSGSAANRQLGDSLAAALRRAGCEVRIHEGMGWNATAGTGGLARNVVAWLPATTNEAGSDTSRTAILLASHYDTVPDGPGAADNAASVAALLVAAEKLARQPVRRRAVVFLLADAEERYLLGSDLFRREDPLARRIAAVINFDHSGRRPPLYHFESAPGSGALMDILWALPRGSGAPRSFSFAGDIYRVLPFDTDFTEYRRLGVPGLNFALVRDGYAYHTSADRSGGVPDEALVALENTMTGLLDALVVRGVGLQGGAGPAVFVAVGPWTWRFSAAAMLALAALGLAGAAFLVARAWRESGRDLLRAAGIVVAAPLLGLVLSTLALVLLRALKGVDQPGYARPAAFFVLLASLVGLAGFLALRLDRARRVASSNLMAAALVPWTALALLTALALPASSGFFVLPLLGLAAGGAWLVARPGRPAALGGGVLALAAMLLAWAEPLSLVLPMLVTTIPKVGPEPLLLWPVVFALLGGLFVPVGLAFLPERGAFGRRRRRWVGATALVALAAAALVLVQPAYDRAHPQRVWTYLVGRADTAYVVTSSPERLSSLDDGEGSAPVEAGNDLFWLAGSYRRGRATATRLPLPCVTTVRQAGRWIVEVRPAAEVDAVLLSAVGTRLTATEPPFEPLTGRRVTLRQVVGPERVVRFTLVGEIPAQARVQVMSLGTTLPPPLLEALRAGRAGSERRAFMDRTIAVVELEPGWQTR
ncbi:MAG: M28 family peptidase [Candidatus Eisenbacteria bacterium]